ncbi:cell division protein FtsQ/DivIB [Streptomyces nodosus]|uniref:Cell division protein FtsQ n=1 Tax=Streptomyces nodosus TaxID=40318 RepID=A0A0B5D9M4_9ACTN|nr:FtsQ-type POTRA domain-containing protein [Streptomyces nodosus]AJE40283.1 cell division protein FtsQ [Streptomyces nodosus]QEV38857.1 FtsQ-type POTRA domain-containing protein [Streptomyces nodosus]
MAGPTTAERGARQKPESGSLRPPRAARLFRLRMLIILFLVVMATGGSVWLLYGSSWLRLTRVSVSGTRVMTDAQVREAAGVRLGTPLISLDTDEIEARLRRELPRIDSVEVVRSWPHGIGLNVTERTPVLILASGGKFIEVDKGGVRYATIPQRPKSVPALELTVTRSASLSRFGTTRLVREAARVTRDLPADVARDLRTVKVRSYDAVSLELSGGRTVVWGSSERGRAKAATLAALMKTAPRARHFDVSVPTAPASSGS